MKRILVTGASGFIGSRCLAKLLARGYEVHGVGRHIQSIDPRIRIHQVDLLNQMETDRLLAELNATHLLHVAWIATPEVFWASSINYEWLKSGVLLAERFYQLGGQRFVGVGSCAEYSVLASGPCREFVTDINPTSVYGSAKAALSFALQSAALLHQRSYVWARVFFPYGLGEPQQKLISRLLSQLNHGKLPELRDPGRRLDFIHVDDVAEALAVIVDSTLEGPVNVGSGNPISIAELVKIIIESFYPQLTEAIRNGAFAKAGVESDMYADIRRLASATGFTPRISLSEGISEMQQLPRGKKVTCELDLPEG